MSWWRLAEKLVKGKICMVYGGQLHQVAQGTLGKHDSSAQKIVRAGEIYWGVFSISWDHQSMSTEDKQVTNK